MKHILMILLTAVVQPALAADTNQPVTIFIQVDLCSKTEVVVSDNGVETRSVSQEIVPVVLGPAYVNVVQIGWFGDSKCSTERTVKIYNSRRELVGRTFLRRGDSGNRYFAFTFEHDTETVEKSEYTETLSLNKYGG